MRQLNDCETEKYSLEVWQCDCGFHIGIDTTYLDQVGPVKFNCPACGNEIEINEYE